MNKKNIDQVAEAKRYFLLGLNSKEISKLMDIPYRTIQNWICEYHWKQERKEFVSYINQTKSVTH